MGSLPVGEFGGGTGGIVFPQIRVHPELWNLALFGNGVFADVIS